MIVLDTHAWLWWAADQDKIPTRVRRRLDRERELVLSPISCWEVGMLVQKGRLRLRGDVRLAIQQALHIPRLRVAVVTDAIATEAGLLGAVFHGDPADRLIVATALELGATVVTKDERIHGCGLVQTLW